MEIGDLQKGQIRLVEMTALELKVWRLQHPWRSKIKAPIQAGALTKVRLITGPSQPHLLLQDHFLEGNYSCNNITTTLIQISRLFILAFSPKLTIR